VTKTQFLSRLNIKSENNRNLKKQHEEVFFRKIKVKVSKVKFLRFYSIIISNQITSKEKEMNEN